jgi:hypothetical protein
LSLFFPPEYRSGPDYAAWRALDPVARLMLQREFVGVSYLHRFVLLKRNRQAAAGNLFRREQPAAGRFIHRKLAVGRLLWRRRELVRSYLKLVFRHYLFGFLVQLAGRKHELELPEPGPGCYWEAPVNLVVLQWLNRHPELWQQPLERCLEGVLDDGIRHYFIYCLRICQLARELYDRAGLAAEAAAVRAAAIPGRVPLGLELEFSNLGPRAVDKECPAVLIAGDPFRNFEYYDQFHLEDVTWRLGGYVDTHEHGRRTFSLTPYGGFFEYALVRVDYPRTYTLPLTTDPALAAAMISASIAFLPEIGPHSLHVNIQADKNGARRKPQLADYICLLLLGGDLVREGSGKIREKRLADGEFTRFVKLRRHLSLLDEKPRRVAEFAFLRLRPERDYELLLLILKGFQSACCLEDGTREIIPALVAWARRPTPPAAAGKAAFTDLVRSGLAAEGVYGRTFLDAFTARLQNLLELRCRQLAGPAD